jgi:hypothetical protein
MSINCDSVNTPNVNISGISFLPRGLIYLQGLTKYIYITADNTTGYQTYVSTANPIIYNSGGIYVSNYRGNTSQTIELNLTKGTCLVHIQELDTNLGTNTLVFKCPAGVTFETNSIIESRNNSNCELVQSSAGNNTLTFTPTQATTNLLTIGSKLMFTCVTDGEIRVSFYLSNSSTSTTGSFSFSTT